jgi:hypothetical protein
VVGIVCHGQGVAAFKHLQGCCLSCQSCTCAATCETHAPNNVSTPRGKISTM